MDTHQDPDRRLDEARESLLARAEELGRRIKDAREKLDVPAHITANPRIAVGIAFAVGALLGFPGKRVHHAVTSDVKSGLLGAAMATLGTLAFNLAKSVAFHQLTEQAKAWWDQKQGQANETGATRTRDVDPFLGH